MNTRTNSKALFQRAKNILIGGVDSPARAFNSVGGDPIFFKHGIGPHLHSEDGEKFIDYVLSWGPHLFGHANEKITTAIIEAVHQSTSYGAPNYRETILGELVREFFPSCERVRFVNSGTEATMTAIRLARGATGRKKILKFNGCYHGHVDSLLVKAGSGGLTLGVPDSLGIPHEISSLTLTQEYNDKDQLREAFEQHPNEIATVIIEGVPGNMGVVIPDLEFLKLLRQLCTQHGTLLIFDEVMSGFRVHPGGAQALYDIEPDLTCLGKVIGGGMPCAAYGGRQDIMRYISPEGPVYQAGTLSGNPVAMAAGIAMLSLLKDEPELFKKAVKHTETLVQGLKTIQKKFDIPFQVNHVGTMFTLFLTDQPVKNLKNAMTCDTDRFKRLHQGLLNEGIYTAPSQFEANFMSALHTDKDIEDTLEAYEKTLQEVSKL
jgi:glutamate-1-semialdehyde 2,1-aminomutase